MFERFTEQARQVIVLAHVEARLLGHDRVATEHLLLGLATEQDGLPARILESLDVTATGIRDEVVACVGVKEGAAPVALPFDEAATRVVEHAVREADGFGQRSVGSEHLLLGVVRETEGTTARVLQQLGLDEETVRGEVLRMAMGPGARLAAFITQTEVQTAAGAPRPAAAARAPTEEFPDVELLSESDLDLLID